MPSSLAQFAGASYVAFPTPSCTRRWQTGFGSRRYRIITGVLATGNGADRVEALRIGGENGVSSFSETMNSNRFVTFRYWLLGREPLLWPGQEFTPSGARFSSAW
jgi:hypothetical protein